MDGTAPLNANETWKQEDNGLNVRERIESVYSNEGFDSIDGTDLHGRFRWWGLYTQRKPGIDGGKTATLEPHELEDKYFMLRVRIDGGALTTEQLRVIGEISVDFARGSADLTDRQNIQLHWIRVEDVPEIWRRLEGVGLSTTEACGDVPRVILGSPVAGIAKDEIIDPTPLIHEIAERFIGDPELANLPRKFKTAITGHPSPGRGARDQRHRPGGRGPPRARRRLRPLGRRRLVHQPAPGRTPRRLRHRRAGRRGLARRHQHLPRLRLPPHAHQGPPEVPDERLGTGEVPPDPARTNTSATSCPTAPPLPSPRRPGDHIGVHEQKDGKFFIGVTPAVGPHSPASSWSRWRTPWRRTARYRLRTTPHQKLVVLDVAKEQVEPLVAELDALGLSARPSVFRRGTIACTGIEFCKLAIVETKVTAATAVAELERRLADLAETKQLPSGTVPAHQRLPQLLRPYPDGGHRPQGHDAANARRRPHPGFPGPPRRRAGVNDEREEAGLGRTVRGLKVTAGGPARLRGARGPEVRRRARRGPDLRRVGTSRG